MPRVENRFAALLAEKRRRDKKQWTYRDIAAVTGISTSTLSRFSQQKHEQFDGETLATLCEFLGCTLGELLVLTEQDASEGQQLGEAVA